MSLKDYRSLASELVAELKRQGADAADVYVVSTVGFNTMVRLGKIERLQQSINKGLGLRVIKNGAMANTFTTDFADRAVKDLAKDTMQIVQVSNADKNNGLAPKEMLGSYDGKLMLFDPSIAKLTPEKKIEMARAAEEAGMKFDKRIKNANGTSWNDSQSQVTLANSDGFVGQYQGTSASLSCSLLAEDEDGTKQTDGHFTFGRFLSSLADPKLIGEEAGRRVVRKLGGRKVKSAVVPVVLDPRVASFMLGDIFGAATGGSIYRRMSYLVDKVGQQVTSPMITIVDDAIMADGVASRPFDAEGVKSSSVVVIEKGVLKQYVCDSYAARRLNLKPTGNAARSYQGNPNTGSSNLYIKNGDTSPADIIKSVKNGLYLDRVGGQGMNSTTGDFSMGANGQWIENGEITHAVQEITVAGNILKVLSNVKAVGNDMNFKLGTTAAPTLLIGEMTVGGE
jgi:PmbA protein